MRYRSGLRRTGSRSAVVPIPSSSGSSSTCAAIAWLPREPPLELAEEIAAGFVVVEMGECGDHQLRSHFAGGVAAHPIGQRQQTRPAYTGVFVIGANQAAIAAGGIAEGKGHGRSSITVLPI